MSDRKIKEIKWVSDEESPKIEVLGRYCYTKLIAVLDDGVIVEYTFNDLVAMTNATVYYFHFYEKNNFIELCHDATEEYLRRYVESSKMYYTTYCELYNWLKKGD